MTIEVFEDGASLFVEAGGGAHVEQGDEPRDEELREREEVGDVDRSEDGRRHEAGRVAHQDGQGEIVDDEETVAGTMKRALARSRALNSGLAATTSQSVGFGMSSDHTAK